MKKIKFNFGYETEKSVRFNEAEEPNRVGAIYIKKWYWKELGNPESIEIELLSTLNPKGESK